MTQWPQNDRERQLGRSGKQLARQLVFSISLSMPGRPPRARQFQLDHHRVVADRAAILTAVQHSFRATQPLDERTERLVWLRGFIRQQLPRLTKADVDRHAQRLIGRRPVDIANWMVGRRYAITSSLVQRLASPRRPPTT